VNQVNLKRLQAGSFSQSPEIAVTREWDCENFIVEHVGREHPNQYRIFNYNKSRVVGACNKISQVRTIIRSS